MSETKWVNDDLAGETRSVVVEGNRYHGKTDKACTTCDASFDRKFYLKVKSNDWMLECPFCQTVLPVPAKTVKVEGMDD